MSWPDSYSFATILKIIHALHQIFFHSFPSYIFLLFSFFFVRVRVLKAVFLHNGQLLPLLKIAANKKEFNCMIWEDVLWRFLFLLPIHFPNPSFPKSLINLGYLLLFFKNGKNILYNLYFVYLYFVYTKIGKTHKQDIKKPWNMWSCSVWLVWSIILSIVYTSILSVERHKGISTKVLIARRALLLYRVYGVSTLLVLNGYEFMPFWLSAGDIMRAYKKSVVSFFPPPPPPPPPQQSCEHINRTVYSNYDLKNKRCSNNMLGL